MTDKLQELAETIQDIHPGCDEVHSRDIAMIMLIREEKIKDALSRSCASTCPNSHSHSDRVRAAVDLGGGQETVR